MTDKPCLFERLGGTRSMAELLGKPPSTVQSWKTAGRIPAHEQPEVLVKAAEAGFDISSDDVVFPLGAPLSPEADAAA